MEKACWLNFISLCQVFNITNYVYLAKLKMDWGFSGAKKERRGRRAELPEEVAKKLKSCSVIVSNLSL
jgi:hypothetical protein